MENNRPIKVCYFGTYRKNYGRNQMMIAGLRLNGVLVIECHETLWRGIEDRVEVASGGWAKPRFWLRIVKTYWRLIKRYKDIEDHDLVIVGYPGQLDVLLARLLSLIRHKPLIWDILMSIYLIACDRGLDKENRFSVNLLYLLESIALKLPDMLILDTKDYVDWFTRNYKVNADKFRLVPIGADDRIFFRSPNNGKDNQKFFVLYAGTFIPNHGVRYIVEAADLLVGEPEIEFILIGEGPELEFSQNYVSQHRLTNVTFLGWMDKERLVEMMKQADVCLGAFGNTTQSLMTIHNKIYEALAIEKPLISGDSPAIRQVFTHGEHIYLCERENANSLSQAIIDLWRDPILRNKIAQNGYRKFTEEFCLKKKGFRFKTHLLELIK